MQDARWDRPFSQRMEARKITKIYRFGKVETPPMVAAQDLDVPDPYPDRIDQLQRFYVTLTRDTPL